MGRIPDQGIRRRRRGNGERHPGRFPVPGPFVMAVALAAGIHSMSVANAAPAVDTQDRLRQIERDLQAGEKQRAKLDARAEALEQELAELRASLISAAAEARAKGEELDRLETELARLDADEAARSARIEADRAALAELLAALQRLSRMPPEAMIARPEPPSRTLKSALLLRAAVPQLKERADALAAELEQLASLRTELAAQREEVAAAAAALDRRHAETAKLAARREELYRSTDSERQALSTRLAALAGQAGDLKELIDKVEAERRAAAERQRAEEAARQAQAQAERERRAKERAEAMKRAPGMSKSGGMILPVGGDVVTRYGEQDRFGVTSRGLTLKGRAGADVVAPLEGSVMFAGPFKGYGLILILEHAGGYHSLLAGLGRIDGQVGQHVLAGEPLGALSSDGTPTMYFELRRGGQPINPMHGVSSSDGKGQS